MFKATRRTKNAQVTFHNRKVLAWWLSNSMDAEFCVEALKEALAKHGTPETFNTEGRSSHRLLGPTDCGAQTCVSQWMARAGSLTTSSLNGCGDL